MHKPTADQSGVRFNPSLVVIAVVVAFAVLIVIGIHDGIILNAALPVH